jgi:acyl-CoA thioester hydrolase
MQSANKYNKGFYVTEITNEFGAPFEGSVRKVKPEWIDFNGHFNMAYYSVLFDQCSDEAFSLVGLGPDYVKERNCSYFTLEAQVNYLAELKVGDEVRITLQLHDYDAKRIHFFLHMFHAKHGWLSATMESLCLHVDMAEKKAAPWPDDVRRKIAAMYEAHKNLPVPEQLGHTIGIVRKMA